MEVFSDWLVTILGGDRYLELAYSLRHDPVLMAMYVAEYLVLAFSLFVIAASLLIRRDRLSGVNRPAAALYGLTFLACGAFSLTNLLTIFLPVFRLDVVVGGAAASIAAINMGFTVQSLFGHTDDPREPRGARRA